MIVHASIAPHSPALLPTISKEHFSELAQTIQSLEIVSQHAQKEQPDTILLIAPHDTHSEEGKLTIHVPPVYKATFEEFGDLATTLTFTSDPLLADSLKTHLLKSGIGVVYDSDEHLEYSSSVPLAFYTKSYQPKILVIHPSYSAHLKDYHRIGTLLQPVLQESPKKIAVIASADLSHCLSEAAPGGYKPEALKCENDILRMIKSGRTSRLLKLDEGMIANYEICGLPSILVLLGILEPMHHTANVLSHEAPFGVGHIVAEYTF